MSYSWIYHQEEVLLTTYMVHTYLHIHWPTFSSTCWQFEGWTHNPGHLFKHWIHASWCPIHGFTIRRRSYWQFTGCIHTYTYTGPPFQALCWQFEGWIHDLATFSSTCWQSEGWITFPPDLPSPKDQPSSRILPQKRSEVTYWQKTTAPKIPMWSPTMVLAGRHPG